MKLTNLVYDFMALSLAFAGLGVGVFAILMGIALLRLFSK